MKNTVFIIILFIVVNLFSSTFIIPDYKDKVDLNTASFEQISKLPITPKQAKDIYDYREFISFFKSIYDLRKIPSIDESTLLKLKPYVIISHHKLQDKAAQRREDIHYLIERLGNNEGSQEGVSDIWEDFLMTPRNINNLYFSELLNIPNVSSIDAAAIMNSRKLGDRISSYRNLRKIPGLSHYGAVNLKNYIYYKHNPTQANRLYIDYQFKYDDSPYEDDIQDMFKENMLATSAHTVKQSYWGYFNMDKVSPAIANKIRIRYNNQYKAGFLYYSNKGERNLFKSNSKNIFKNGKYYLGYSPDFSFGKFKFILGNYRATFGEGLVMENTDFYSPRKTGYGFSKRILGIIPDLSRTQEYALRGGAVQFNSTHFNFAGFLSSDNKDAIVFDSNKNGKIDDNDDVLCFVTLSRRFENSQLEEAEHYFFPDSVKIAPRLDYVNEKLGGFHLSYSPIIGSHIGLTAINSIYNKDFTVYQLTGNKANDLRYLLIEGGKNGDDPLKKFKLADTEISSLYSTKSYKYAYDRNYRRVMGIDWMTTINNTSIQGEYAQLSVNSPFFGNNPSALVLSSYTQFDNLYFLAMYRNYDLEFDNPYSRAFAESPRFDDTVFEKLTYGLNNTLLTDLYNNSAQASPEEGFYFETRYQFNKYLTISKAYLDIWKRKSDSRRNIRFEGTLQFRPIHELRFDLRYKQQIKRYDDTLDRSRSKVDETTFKIRSYLSNYDVMQFEYRYSRTLSPPYTSLTNPAEAGAPDMAQANVSFDGDYVSCDYTHNFNKTLKLRGAIMFWKGNHWDFEDVNLDFVNDEGMKYWFKIVSNVSNNLYLSIKFKHERRIPHYKEFRKYNDIPDSGEYYFPRVENQYNSIRIQLDWKL